MNPLTNMKNVVKLSERELTSNSKVSWHDEYKDSAWIFVGGLPFDLSEGDIVTVFSQYGEVVHINLIRDKETGKPKGFCFICYEDQRSTILAVDNLNGIKVLGRILRVDHVREYKPPKDKDDKDKGKRKRRDDRDFDGKRNFRDKDTRDSNYRGRDSRDSNFRNRDSRDARRS